MEERDTYHRAFIQVTNLWEKDERARRLTFSRRLAGIAAALLEVFADEKNPILFESENRDPR